MGYLMKVFTVGLIVNNSQKGCAWLIGIVILIVICSMFVSPFRHARPSKKEYLSRYLPEADVSPANVSFVFVGGVGGDASFSRIIIESDAQLTWTNQWVLKQAIHGEYGLSKLQLRSSEFGATGIVVADDFEDVEEIRVFEDERIEKGMSMSRELYVPVPYTSAIYLLTFGPD